MPFALIAMVSQSSLAGGLTSGGRLPLPGAVAQSSGAGRATLAPVSRPVAMELGAYSYVEAKLAGPSAFPAGVALALSLAYEKRREEDIAELEDPLAQWNGGRCSYRSEERIYVSYHDEDGQIVVVLVTCSELRQLLDHLKDNAEQEKLAETRGALEDAVEALGDDECQSTLEQQGDTDLCDLDLTCASFAIQQAVADYCASSW